MGLGFWASDLGLGFGCWVKGFGFLVVGFGVVGFIGFIAFIEFVEFIGFKGFRVGFSAGRKFPGASREVSGLLFRFGAVLQIKSLFWGPPLLVGQAYIKDPTTATRV